MDRINGANTVNIGSGRRGWREQDKTAGLAGTEMKAAWFNGIQEEILAVIEGAGLIPAPDVWTQLRQAIGIMITLAAPEIDMSPYLEKAGGTMTGELLLWRDPEQDMEAATKRFVEGLIPSLAAYLLKSGGTMTGELLLYRDPVDAAEAATKQYADRRGAWDVVVEGRTSPGVGEFSSGSGYQTRNLNTLLRNTAGASIASNKVTLPAGTWAIEFDGGGGKMGWHRIDLFADASTLIQPGTWAFSYITDSASGWSSSQGAAPAVVIAAPTAFYLNHWSHVGAGPFYDNVSVGGSPNVGARFRARKIA